MQLMSDELGKNTIIHLYAINQKYFQSSNKCYFLDAHQSEVRYWLTIWCIATDIMIVSHTN